MKAGVDNRDLLLEIEEKIEKKEHLYYRLEVPDRFQSYQYRNFYEFKYQLAIDGV